MAEGTRFAKIDDAIRALKEDASEFKRTSLATQAVADQRLSHMEATMKNVEAILQHLEVSHSSLGNVNNSGGSTGSGARIPQIGYQEQ
ncbi:uncharacterized protein G2W53_014036 [Senna tora]|uniref:Uncharacterized protein n=1 Tax=Senna tora TaxID=362788 RepID=A0A834TZS3_9FABA|nr:uncharacterized protein G2W53_014036 [Senna tora]